MAAKLWFTGSMKRLRFGSMVLALGFGLQALTACDRKDPEACEEALTTTRQAIARETFDAAQQWREFAWKQCSEKATLEALDKDLTGKRAEVEARKRSAEQLTQTKRDLLKVFLSWVAANRTAPERASATPSCDPLPADDAKAAAAKQRLCTATRAAGEHQLVARYFEAETTAARFNVKLPDVTTCEEIGATQVKTWSVAATGGRTAARFRCEFTSGPLAGLHAVLSQAVNADFYVFNPTYLDKEPAYRSILDTQ